MKPGDLIMVRGTNGKEFVIPAVVVRGAVNGKVLVWEGSTAMDTNKHLISVVPLDDCRHV